MFNAKKKLIAILIIVGVLKTMVYHLLEKVSRQLLKQKNTSKIMHMIAINITSRESRAGQKTRSSWMRNISA